MIQKEKEKTIESYLKLLDVGHSIGEFLNTSTTRKPNIGPSAINP